jgi:hypothetical protein
MSVMTDGDALERCPNCFHTICLDGLNDPDCACYCHKAVEEMMTWLIDVEERRI